MMQVVARWRALWHCKQGGPKDVSRPESRGSAVARIPTYLLVAALLGVAFWGAFGLGRFGDEWHYVLLPMQAVETGRVFDYLMHRDVQHWTPLWHGLELTNYLLAGLSNDAFVRGFNMVTQALSLMAVAHLCLHWRLHCLGVVASMLALGLHHTSAGPLYHFDNSAYCATDCLGWWGAVLVVRSVATGKRFIGRSSVILLALGLLFREQCLAAAAVYVWILLWSWLSDSGRCFDWRRGVLAVAPTVTVVVIYAGVRRFYAGVPFQVEGAFRLSPQDVPRNAVQMATALLSPVRTLVWFDAFRAEPREWDVLVLATVALCLTVLAVIIGLHQSWKRSQTLRHPLFVALGAMILSWFPTAMMAHVGEAYVHTSLFWFAALVGLSVDGWARVVKSRLAVVSLFGALGAYGSSLGHGLRANLSEMRLNGERARLTIRAVRSVVAGLPADTSVHVCDVSPQVRRTDYSMYRAQTYKGLTWGIETMALPELAGEFGGHVRFVPDACGGDLAAAKALVQPAGSRCVLMMTEGAMTLRGCSSEGTREMSLGNPMRYR